MALSKTRTRFQCVDTNTFPVGLFIVCAIAGLLILSISAFFIIRQKKKTNSGDEQVFEFLSNSEDLEDTETQQPATSYMYQAPSQQPVVDTQTGGGLKFCTSCGAELAPGVKFCNACGAKRP
jgi:hypothetical protein